MSHQKKICVVVHSTVPGGGVQEQRINFVNNWLENGYEVDVICPKKGASEIEEYNKKGVIYLSNNSSTRSNICIVKEKIF